MTPVFDFYARYYDLLYRDKDYAAEGDYVASLIREQAPDAAALLELGCGTGAHAAALAGRGFAVHGVDVSEPMLNRARERMAALQDAVAVRIGLSQGDARTVRIGRTFDAVLALFHVMSYQPTRDDLAAVLDTCAQHCGRGGVLVFDFWHGPAVLAQKPELRVKRMRDADIAVTRIAEPDFRPDERIVDVHYEVWIESAEHGIEKITECHSMRYWFADELEAALAAAGFDLCGFHAWMTSRPPTADDWSACVVARRQ